MFEPPLGLGQRRAIGRHLVLLRLDLLVARGQRIHGQVGFEFPHLRRARISRRLRVDQLGLRNASGLELLLVARQNLGRPAFLSAIACVSLCSRHIDFGRSLARLQIAEPRLELRSTCSAMRTSDASGSASSAKSG